MAKKTATQKPLPHFTLHHTVGALYLSQPISKPKKPINQGTSSTLKFTNETDSAVTTIHLLT